MDQGTPKPKYKPIPPVSGQWKPGQSGNPKGRPKTAKFREAQERFLRALDDNRGADGAALADLAATIYAKGMAGDISAAREFLDRLEGKTPISVGGANDLPPLGFAWLDTLAPAEQHVIEPPVLEGDETKHLLESPANARRLAESIDQANNGDLTEAPKIDDGTADPSKGNLS